MRLLSKSRLIAFRQCPKRLWLELYRPELREESVGTLASYAVGHQVGEVAQRIYDPKGVGAVIDAKKEGYDEAFTRSAQLLGESRRPIFEAGFKAEGALAFADVMLPVKAKGKPAWRMVEVKSSTSVKDYHLDDIAVQTFVAQSAGVRLESVALAFVDSHWVYPGEENYEGLLVETDLTAETFARTAEVKGWLTDAQTVAAQKSEPKIGVGAHCFDPFECGFCTYCHRDIPQPQHPVDWLPGISAKKRAQLAEMNIIEMADVPDAQLNDRQRQVRERTRDGTVHFDAAGAAADLAPHGFPAHFLDFETIQFAVPIWKGTSPYQSIPFQFSLHVLTADGALAHQEFLDLSGEDPTGAFAKGLVAACGQDGPIYAYNAGFEAGRITDLAKRLPQLAKPLQAINARIVDLLPVARNRYYHPSQQGSWSIKAVLPAAIPELSYERLEGVKDGNMAMAAYDEAVRPATTEARRQEIKHQLLAYCRLDTFALVRLWQVFSGRSGHPLVDHD